MRRRLLTNSVSLLGCYHPLVMVDEGHVVRSLPWLVEALSKWNKCRFKAGSPGSDATLTKAVVRKKVTHKVFGCQKSLSRNGRSVSFSCRGLLFCLPFWAVRQEGQVCLPAVPSRSHVESHFALVVFCLLATTCSFCLSPSQTDGSFFFFASAQSHY